MCLPDGWKKVRVKDYSDTGIRFFSNHSIPVGIDVIFKLGAIFSAAKVVWSTGNDAGLEFYREISDQAIVRPAKVGLQDGPKSGTGAGRP